MRKLEARKAYNEAYRLAHREEIRVKGRAYCAAHREELKAKHKAYYASHKDQEKAYRVSHKEKIKANNKAYRLAHLEEIRSKDRVYRLAHRPEISEQEKAYRLAHRPEKRAKDRARYLANRERLLAYQKAYRIVNKKMISAKKKVRHAAHKEEIRNRRLNKLYGLTQAEFDTLLEKQGGRCAICKTDEFNAKGPVVDHDHFSGQTRGILCNNCNSGIGYFRDLTYVMEAAIEYLAKYSCGWSAEMPEKLRRMCEEEHTKAMEMRGNA